MKAVVNDMFEIDLDSLRNQDVSVVVDGDNILARINGVNYRMRLTETPHDNKKYEIEINNRIYCVRLENDLDQMVNSMGLKGKRTQTVKELKSPMPGLVFRILKSEGDEVVDGETILILEAMKMENSIKSPGNGRIKSIPVKEGQSIEKGGVLVQFE